MRRAAVEKVDDCEEIVATFIEFHEAATQRAYKSLWAAWCRFLGHSGAMASVDDANRFLLWYKASRAVSLGTLRHRVQILHSLYEHLRQHGTVRINPFVDVLPAVRRWRSGDVRPTQMVNFERVHELFDHCPRSTPKSYRNRVLMMVLFGAGLRLGDALKLRVCDVCETVEGHAFLRLTRTKKGRQEERGLPGWLGNELWAYKKRRTSEVTTMEAPLLTSYRGFPPAATNRVVPPESARRWFKRICMEVGLPAYLTPHSARATAITKLLADGLSYREVQEFSGHSSVQAVELYDKRRFSLDNHPAGKLNYGIAAAG